MSETLLSVEDLRTYFYTYAGVVKAVDGITLQVNKGETLGLVGESGSGKTVTAQSIMRIVPQPGKIVRGTIEYQGKDLRRLTDTGLFPGIRLFHGRSCLVAEQFALSIVP